MLKRSIMTIIIISISCIAVACTNPLQSLKDILPKQQLFKNKQTKEAKLEETVQTDNMEDVKLRETVMYYKDDKGYLVPIMKKIKWEEGIARAALKGITGGTEADQLIQKSGLYPTIPDGTQILGMTINDGIAKIDLSAEANNCRNAEEERLMVKAIVYTLTEFNNIEAVQIMINGEILKQLKFGSRTDQPIHRQGINTIGSTKGSRVVVYFYKENSAGFKYFVPVSAGTSSGNNSIEAAIKCLMQGPPVQSGLESDIPQGARILNISIKNGIAYLNFKKGIFDIQGSEKTGENIVKSVIYTLKEYDSVKGVQFLVEGSPAELPGGIVLSNTIDIPVFTNMY